jgi:hypothetical protein
MGDDDAAAADDDDDDDDVVLRVQRVVDCTHCSFLSSDLDCEENQKVLASNAC